MQQAHWRRCEIVLFGKPVMQPREICYMAEHAGLGYKYSGTEMIVEPFHETVARLKVFLTHCCLSLPSSTSVVALNMWTGWHCCVSILSFAYTAHVFPFLLVRTTVVISEQSVLLCRNSLKKLQETSTTAASSIFTTTDKSTWAGILMMRHSMGRMPQYVQSVWASQDLSICARKLTMPTSLSTAWDKGMCSL